MMVRRISHSWLAACVAVAAHLGACAPDDSPNPTRAIGIQKFAGSQMQGSQMQGSQMQGSQMQGSQMQGHELGGMTLEGAALVDVRVVQGGLVAQRQVTVTGTTSSLSPCASQQSGLPRSCGWTSIGVGTCTPGSAMRLGAAAACGLGSCSGDAMLRVCAGTTPCEHGPLVSGSAAAGMLGENDNACGTGCPEVSFTCPESGTYNVMTGAFHSGDPFSVSATASSGTFPTYTELTGPELQGATLRAQAMNASTSPPTAEWLQFRIAHVAPERPEHAGYGDTWLYTVEQYVEETGAWSNICPEDADGDAAALPVGAVFDPTGARVESTTQFTFACTSGAIAKCYRWGYKPWLAHPDGPEVMPNIHWACTRMARADYCGDGTSHTQDGTLINVWDTLSAPGPFQTRDSIPGMIFEAGWDTDGAVCLSKERWLSLPPGVALSCPDKLIPPGASLAGASVCRSASEVSALAPEVSLFNESMLNLK